LVREQHQHVGRNAVRNQRGDAVVVAEPDFVVRDGVVLVDDGQHAEFEQTRQRLSSVKVLLTVSEVVGHQKNLARHDTVRCEDGVVTLHQATLADRGKRLQGSHVGRPLRKTKGSDTGGNGTTGDEKNLVAVIAQPRDL
jgi:hypothetical protein